MMTPHRYAEAARKLALALVRRQHERAARLARLLNRQRRAFAVEAATRSPTIPRIDWPGPERVRELADIDRMLEETAASAGAASEALRRAAASGATVEEAIRSMTAATRSGPTIDEAAAGMRRAAEAGRRADP